MLGSEQMSLAVQVAAIVAPVAIYFLLLGLLNSQPNPQMLSARSDFILLNAAFAPVFCVPVLNYFGASVWTAPVVIGAMLILALVLAPRRASNWVVYNITLPVALRAAERALSTMGESFERRDRSLLLKRKYLVLKFSSMPLLRNVSISVEGNDATDFGKKFEGLLAAQLAGVSTVATPMAVTFLLIATTMLITPVGLLADRMPEMVRIITDLIR
ncbi:MAG: hypothetical protein SVV80_13255 [Planctomycetota bacterium]|nr:hypothetical protein [Planctomycetota bacterium]